MKLAICQMVSGEDKAANLGEIRRLTGIAAEAGAHVAVFPEFAMLHTSQLSASFVAEGEPLDGPFVQELSLLAEQTGVTLVAGMLEAIPGEDRGYNTVVVVTPGEGLTHTYHKAHLYDAFGFKESEYIRPGDLDGPVTFQAHGVTIGILTCYDLRFPEAARQHADAGADLVLYPAAWVPGPRKEDHWKTLARARAIENTGYVAAVSQGPGLGTGGSLIVDPMGLTIAELGDGVGIAVAEIFPERVADVRATNPCLHNRRFTVAAAG